MDNQDNERFEAQNSENDDLYGRVSQDEIKRLFYRDYDESIEPSYLESDLRYYEDTKEDLVYP